MMKKVSVLSIAIALLCSVFTGCKKDDPELPPVIEDVIATYSGKQLKTVLNGDTLHSQLAAVELIQENDKSLTLKLQNIVPYIKEFSIPNAKFEAATKSMYVSKLSGEYSDNVTGYKVSFAGVVDEGVLTAVVAYEELSGTEVDVKAAGLISKTFKGEMGISLEGLNEPPVKVEQRVYTAAASGTNPTKFKIQINNFSFEGLNLGNIVLDTIPVQERGMQGEYPIYSFQAEERQLEIKPVGKVSLNVKGTIINGEMTFGLKVAAETGGIKVNVDFKGGAVTESSSTKGVKISIDSPQVPDTILISGNNYTFKIWETASPNQMVLTPKITFTEKITLDSVTIYRAATKTRERITETTPIDFSKFEAGDYVGYHVKAEDIRYTSIKMLKMQVLPSVGVFDMKSWVTDAGNNLPTPKGLTNSNLAAAFLPVFGVTIPTPVQQAEDGAAEITTSRTVSPTQPSTLLPGVTAGTMFIGTFNLALDNTLKSTRFGTAYPTQPTAFKISYRYQPGAEFHKTVVKDSLDEKGKKVTYHDTEIMPNEKDECSIRAYLYEVGSYDEYLDGTNINTSKKVIMKAEVIDGNATSSYIDKEIAFAETGNGTYDPSKKYKIAIVCSSSKRGDEFMGAHGSKLWVKYMEIVSK